MQMPLAVDNVPVYVALRPEKIMLCESRAAVAIISPSAKWRILHISAICLFIVMRLKRADDQRSTTRMRTVTGKVAPILGR